MLVAALYDVHGNLPALKAVVAGILQLGVTDVVVGGDVLPGPMPPETLTTLLNLDVPTRFLYGNGEVAVLEQRAGRCPASVPQPYRPVIEWTAQQLSLADERVLAGWPKTVQMNIPGFGQVLFCHATPRNENEIFTRLTPEERLVPVFREVNVSLVVCGHTHMQFDRTVGSVRVVNAGSIGMPFGKPGADWLLLGPTVQFRHTSYDLEQAAELVTATDYPQAQQFAAHHILKPPSETEMLEVFTRGELK
jgi:diadenosine tetraphosphatase ApaH/serine/threonine PP2A family protein phosphatase